MHVMYKNHRGRARQGEENVMPMLYIRLREIAEDAAGRRLIGFQFNHYHRCPERNNNHENLFFFWVSVKVVLIIERRGKTESSVMS